MSDDYNRRETDRLFGQNKDQYSKIDQNAREIAALRKEFEAIKVDLIGVTGNNGLRGEFRTFKVESEKNDTAIMQTLTDMRKQQAANLRWTVGTIITLVSITIGVLL